MALAILSRYNEAFPEFFVATMTRILCPYRPANFFLRSLEHLFFQRGKTLIGIVRKRIGLAGFIFQPVALATFKYVQKKRKNGITAQYTGILQSFAGGMGSISLPDNLAGAAVPAAPGASHDKLQGDAFHQRQFG